MIPSTSLPKLGVCVKKGSVTPSVIAAMKTLGITRYRSDAPISEGELGYFQALAEAGLTACIDVNGWEGQPMVDTQLGFLRLLVEQFPGSIDFIEGPNEVNNNPQTWNGVTDPANGTDSAHTSAMAVMDYIVATVASDPVLGSIPVLNYTDCTPVAARKGAIANMHVYDNSTPNGPLDWWLDTDGLGKLQKANPGMTEYVVTETGTAQSNATTRETIIEQAVTTLGQMAASGLKAAYIFSLADQDGGSYGLFDGNWNIRPAGQALAGMVALLKDTGAAFTPKPLNLSVQDTTGTVQGLLVAMSDGSYRLFFWTWNPPAKPFTFHWSVDQAKAYDFRNVAGQASLLKWSKSAGQVCDWDDYAGGLIALELH